LIQILGVIPPNMLGMINIHYGNLNSSTRFWGLQEAFDTAQDSDHELANASTSWPRYTRRMSYWGANFGAGAAIGSSASWGMGQDELSCQTSLEILSSGGYVWWIMVLTSISWDMGPLSLWV
jgi:hypothetical protein